MKSRVAVAGVGGQLGVLLFGMLQRLSQQPLADMAHPIGLSGTPSGARAMGKSLYRRFGMAFAPETSVRFIDVHDADAWARGFAGCDAAILSSTYRYERVKLPPAFLRPLSLTPLHEVEMHLDAGASGGTGAASTAARDEDVLAAQLEGASAAGVRNLVLLCPRTSLATLPDLATQWAAAARGCSLRLVATAPSAALCDVSKDWTYLDPTSEPLQCLRVGGDGDGEGEGGGELSDAASADGAVGGP